MSCTHGGRQRLHLRKSPTRRHRISRSRAGALVRAILEVSPLRRHYYTYPLGMTISFTLSMVSMGAFEAWADGCRRACVDSHEIDDLGMGICWQGEAAVQRSLITGFTLRVDGQCTVSSLPQSLSTCLFSTLCVFFRDTMKYPLLSRNSGFG